MSTTQSRSLPETREPLSNETDRQPAPRKRGKLRVVLLVLAAIVVGFVAIVAVQSPEFRVSRSATLSAPPAAVFSHVNDFHNWQAWSPWERLDPALKRTYEGPSAGEGAVYSWAGNNEVGEGRMTIVENRPDEAIRIRLEFLKPFAATNTAEFTFRPEGSGTAVTWTMSGQKTFLCKAIHLFMNVDRMIGDQFEQGLSQLDAAAQNEAK